ncbi:hypothetical protein L2X99_05175 [Microbacterium sp. KUDC0406]|uniref:hypothetical protein n=1 Tax=Microbacterium sp. KUDC0406 TaxID=2909588 RepID=UPI001F164BE9|nr:hypothetical protein [Microbacterium sp. KUDC0406]UJP10991.1 hypothetical protein L2X99_05175 [Microbacterium sp. KUDC0406]
MAGRGNDAQRSRVQAERARRYAARTAWYENRVRTRTRDNVIAGVAGGILVIAAIASQVAHAEATAPSPTPSPSTVVTPSPDPTPTGSPSPTSTPAE